MMLSLAGLALAAIGLVIALWVASSLVLAVVGDDEFLKDGLFLACMFVGVPLGVSSIILLFCASVVGA